MENHNNDAIKQAEAYIETDFVREIKDIYQDAEMNLYEKRMEKKRLILKYIDRHEGWWGLSKDEIKEAIDNIITRATWIDEVEEEHEDYYEDVTEENEMVMRIEIQAEDNLIPQIRKIYENVETNLKTKRQKRQECIREFIDECVNELGANQDDIIAAVNYVIKAATWINEIEEMHEEYYEEER